MKHIEDTNQLTEFGDHIVSAVLAFVESKGRGKKAGFLSRSWDFRRAKKEQVPCVMVEICPEKPGRYSIDVSGIMGLFQGKVSVNFVSGLDGNSVPCVRIIGLWEASLPYRPTPVNGSAVTVSQARR